MSRDFLPQRTPEQCRTHHQKLIARYKTIENVKKIIHRKMGRSLRTPYLTKEGKIDENYKMKENEEIENNMENVGKAMSFIEE